MDKKALLNLMESNIHKGAQADGTSLPPANEVCESYVFTRVCHSVHGGGLVWQGGMCGGCVRVGGGGVHGGGT